MTAVHVPTRIRIETPDAPSAFALERRLAPFHAFALGRGPNWGVEVEDYDEQLAEVTAVVEHWLRDRGAVSTRMYVDGVPRRISVIGDSPLDCEYDAGPVLEHEP